MRTSRALGIVLSAAIIALLTLSATAYKTQKGYVKTRGRLASNGTVIPGKPVPKVIIKLDNGSTVVTDKDGKFSLNLSTEEFVIKRVYKSGYEITNSDILNKKQEWSDIPLVIVLDSTRQQAEDRLASEKKMRRTLQRKLQAKEDELEALKEKNKITTEEYRNALQELYKLQETNEKFISEMAERYSHIDFDELDDFQRQIAAYIQEGELTRADSLLSTIKRPDEQTIKNNLRLNRIRKREKEIENRQSQLEYIKTLQTLQIAEFADECYHRYELYKLEENKDSAAFWLVTRAKIDPDNIEWQIEASDYIMDNTKEYDKASTLYQTALDRAEATADSSGMASALRGLGLVNLAQSEYETASEYFEKALKIYVELFGEDHPLTKDLRKDIDKTKKYLKQ